MQALALLEDEDGQLNLYTSDSTGVYYTLSLEDVVYNTYSYDFDGVCVSLYHGCPCSLAQSPLDIWSERHICRKPVRQISSKRSQKCHSYRHHVQQWRTVESHQGAERGLLRADDQLQLPGVFPPPLHGHQLLQYARSLLSFVCSGPNSSPRWVHGGGGGGGAWHGTLGILSVGCLW